MNKTKILFLLFFLIGSFYGVAQQIHIGATTAYNATFVLDQGLAEDPRYSSTYTYNFAPIGFSFGVDFSNSFGLSLESILSKQGQIYEIIDFAKAVKGQRNIDLTYLNVPLLMKFMSGGNGAARANFNIGPQLSFLTDAAETVQHNGGTFTIPDNPDFILPDNATNVTADTYDVPKLDSEEAYSKAKGDFQNMEFQIAAAFGVDFDLSKHLFLTTQIRANYSLTDMKSGDAWDSITSGNVRDLVGQRANLLVGIQIGLHYNFGITRSFKFK